MSRQSIYEKITEVIIAQLDAGFRPLERLWDNPNGLRLPRRITGESYRGINTAILWFSALDRGYTADTWMTYKAAVGMDAQVRKGEKGTQVVYADKIKKTETAAKSGEDVERIIPYLKQYTVFNAEQIDGLPASYYAIPQRKLLNMPERLQGAEAFIRHTGAVITEGGNRAFYAPSQDRIQMPPYETFKDRESWYAVLLHETGGHWTGHPSRLNRDMKSWSEDRKKYGFEELIAEFASAFLCASLAITDKPLPGHASYIGGWLKLLTSDHKAVFAAAAQAQKAADYMWSLQPTAPAPRPSNDVLHSPAVG